MQTNTTLMRSLVAIFLAFSIWTVTDAEKVSPCCVAVSRNMEDIPITGYRLQNKSLPCVQAVIFLTEKGQFCIYPRQQWVKNKIIEFSRSQKNKMTPTSAIQTSSVTQSSTVSTVREERQTTTPFSK